MATIKNLLVCFLFFVCFHFTGISQISLENIYTSQLGVRERTGKNDGAKVEMYLHAVRLSRGNPWCAAFVKWCLDSAKIKTKITGWAPTAHNPKNLLWYGRKHLAPARPGDVFTLYFPALKRIAHTGFFNKEINTSVYESIEGNTNQAGSRDGDGVYKKYRSYNATYSITRWE